jgi:hypothetical protein
MLTYNNIEYNVSKPGCFCPQVSVDMPILLGPLEEANLIHSRLALSKWSMRVRIFLFTWGRKQI